MSALSANDLSAVQRTYLGVLSLGLVSADQAKDNRFRIEYVSAGAHALFNGLQRDAYLEPDSGGDCAAGAPFRGELRAAIIDLDRKGVIGVGPPQDLMILKPSAPDPDAIYGEVDLNRHPPIFDRFLAQRCMDALLENGAAHAYLMELYAASGDVWHVLYKQGYGNYR